MSQFYLTADFFVYLLLDILQKIRSNQNRRYVAVETSKSPLALVLQLLRELSRRNVEGQEPKGFLLSEQRITVLRTSEVGLHGLLGRKHWRWYTPS